MEILNFLKIDLHQNIKELFESVLHYADFKFVLYHSLSILYYY